MTSETSPHSPEDHWVLDLDSRRRIFVKVRDVPGIHLRRLQRQLGIPLGTLKHHLQKLEDAGLLESHRERRKRSYFVRGQVEAKDQRYLYYLRYRASRRILMELLDHPRTSLRALAERLSLRPATVSYHLRKLTDGGIVSPHGYGRGRRYVVADPDRFERFMDQYRMTFRDLAPTAPRTRD